MRWAASRTSAASRSARRPISSCSRTSTPPPRSRCSTPTATSSTRSSATTWTPCWATGAWGSRTTASSTSTSPTRAAGSRRRSSTCARRSATRRGATACTPTSPRPPWWRTRTSTATTTGRCRDSEPSRRRRWLHQRRQRVRHRPRRRRGDRVRAARPHLEVGHHVVVLVDHVVAVHHVLPAPRPELRDHPHHLPLPGVRDVLGADLVGQRRLPVPVEDLEVGQVDVDGVEPAARTVVEGPDLDVVLARGRVHPGRVPELVVDRPLPLVALETPFPRAHRLVLGQWHRVEGRSSGIEDRRHLVVRLVRGLGGDVEAHYLPGGREVVVVLQRQVPQDHLLTDAVLREVDHDAVALRLADPELRRLLGTRIEPAVARHERERLSRAQREAVGTGGGGVEDAEQVLAPLDLEERRRLAVDENDVPHQGLLPVVEEEQLAVGVEDLVLDHERNLVAALGQRQ